MFRTIKADWIDIAQTEIGNTLRLECMCTECELCDPLPTATLKTSCRSLAFLRTLSKKWKEWFNFRAIYILVTTKARSEILNAFLVYLELLLKSA